ncbi:MAG TPA: hypothetical protein VG759_17130, partial [Candidatus Angelobacter sp.]|nr:hypothetical protein [Candidatus Angelobacter sp.]
MRYYLHLVDYVLWATVIVAQVVLFVEAIRRRVAADLPRFLAYLAFLSFDSVVLLLISTYLPYKVYFYT